MVAPSELPAGPNLPCGSNGHTHPPRAGLAFYATDAYYAVVNGKRGGALHVNWRTGAPVLDDPGVSVVFSRKTRCSGQWDRHAHGQVTPSSTTSQSVLQAPRGAPRPEWWRIGWIVGRRDYRALAKDGIPPDSNRVPGPAKRQRLAHDWHRREIMFRDDMIQIRDVIHCRLPCRTIICQSPLTEEAHRFVDSGNLAMTNRAPLFVEGGKKVEVWRVYRQGKLVEQRFTRA